MPVKTKKTHHRTPHDKHGHRRGKKFLKIYAPYIPLMLILGIGFIVATKSGFSQRVTNVLGYAISMDSSELLNAANKERAAHNKPPLTLNEQLTQAAQKKAQDMSARNYWSHTTPDGQEPWVFVQKEGYNYTQAAENLAYGFATGEAATSGWMNSPSHRLNLLNGELSDVGFGIVNVPNYQNNGEQTIVVALYGRPVASTVPAVAVQQPASPPHVAPATTANQEVQKISLAQTITNGTMPWINFVAGLILGGVSIYLFSKHTLALRRTFRQGERFILHHPLLDITLISLVALSALLTQTAGIIH